MSNTIRLHRVVKAPAERIYRAFIEPLALAKWMPPHGFTAQIHEMDAQVGGTYKMSFTNFGTGKSHSFHGRYLDMIPNEKLVYVDQFDTADMSEEMTVTVTLKTVRCGTELRIVQDNISDLIPLELCYLGWQESLDMLMQLVEPEISDEG
jgi:uncharacterized protein YndB with AHSA1/START domain